MGVDKGSQRGAAAPTWIFPEKTVIFGGKWVFLSEKWDFNSSENWFFSFILPLFRISPGYALNKDRDIICNHWAIAMLTIALTTTIFIPQGLKGRW